MFLAIIGLVACAVAFGYVLAGWGDEPVEPDA